MPADLDGDMTPVTVENLERVVVHVRLLLLQVIIRPDVPHRRLRPPDQDQKQALGNRCLGQIVTGQVMLAFPRCTVDDRNAERLGVASRAPAEPAGRPHYIRWASSKVSSDPVSAR